MTQINIIYRNNDLYEKHISKIEDHLKSSNKEVKVRVFQEDTKESEIDQWYKENKNDLSGKVFLTDATCFPNFTRIQEHAEIGELDHILRNSYLNALENYINFPKKIFEMGRRDSLDEIENFESFYSQLFKYIFQEKIFQPKEVHIIDRNISDHAPLLERKIFGDYIRDYQNGGDFLISKEFRDYIRGAGFPEKEIYLHADYDGTIDKKENCILVDRHNKNIKNIKNATYLILPAVDLLESISRQNIAKIPEEKVDEKLFLTIDRWAKKF